MADFRGRCRNHWHVPVVAEGLARGEKLIIWYPYVGMLMCDMSIFGTWNHGISGTWCHGSIKWCHVDIMKAYWVPKYRYFGGLDHGKM